MCPNQRIYATVALIVPTFKTNIYGVVSNSYPIRFSIDIELLMIFNEHPNN